MWLMERGDDPFEHERPRRLAALDSAALERDRLLNAALGDLDRRLRCSARSPRG